MSREIVDYSGTYFFGAIIALGPLGGGSKMPTCNSELQASEDRLTKEIEEATAKRRKLEEDLRTVDAVSQRRIDLAALRDIEAYRNRRRLPHQAVQMKLALDRRAGTLQPDGDAKPLGIHLAESAAESLPATITKAI